MMREVIFMKPLKSVITQVVCVSIVLGALSFAMGDSVAVEDSNEAKWYVSPSFGAIGFEGVRQGRAQKY